MKKIPTAEEFLGQDESGVYSEQDITKAMIGFAKMHVEQALKEASENVLLSRSDSMIGGCPECFVDGVDSDSILNSYPLDNIK